MVPSHLAHTHGTHKRNTFFQKKIIRVPQVNSPHTWTHIFLKKNIFLILFSPAPVVNYPSFGAGGKTCATNIGENQASSINVFGQKNFSQRSAHVFRACAGEEKKVFRVCVPCVCAKCEGTIKILHQKKKKKFQLDFTFRKHFRFQIFIFRYFVFKFISSKKTDLLFD